MNTSRITPSVGFRQDLNADFNNDGVVDRNDDLNRDGRIDWLDHALATKLRHRSAEQVLTNIRS